MAMDRSIPVFSHFRRFTEAGTLASFGSDYPQIGKQAARLAHNILNGTPADTLPFEVTQHYEYVVNVDEMKNMDLEVSNSLRSKVHSFVHTAN